MPETIQSVCHVDFSGDLRTTTCEKPLFTEAGELAVRTTIYISSATCPGCQGRIQQKIDLLRFAPPKAETATYR